MIDYSRLYNRLSDTPLAAWLDDLPGIVSNALSSDKNRLLPEWQAVIEALPIQVPGSVDLCQGAVRIGEASDLEQAVQDELIRNLKKLHPWRKGPFSLFGVDIETEWRSDWKWDRLENHIQPLEGRIVLDVGCGNGYHCWRMRGAGAKLVIGIDPMLLFVAQYGVLAHYLKTEPVHVLPLKIEDISSTLSGFDTVFSMGVLYHRRSPIDHLMKLKGLLRDGGELVLETLVVEGDLGYSLVPDGRYAKMRNVWFIPSPDTLLQWVTRCGFKESRLIDVTQTTSEEQRSTEWMHFESLSDFLNPHDASKTIEGYPAPKRAIILAQK